MQKRNLPQITASSKSRIKQPCINNDARRLSCSFEYFKCQPICINHRFNNHFRDSHDYFDVLYNFLGVVLPKICEVTYNELKADNHGLHFHVIKEVDKRELINKIMKEYNYNNSYIEQVVGDSLFEFKASLQGHSPSRVVAYLSDNIIYVLFFDTNHHIYIDKDKTKDSLYFEYCPTYLESKCKYMPDDCFAVDYLDVEKIEKSYCYK